MALTKLTQSLIDGTLVTSVNGNTGAVTTGIDLQSSVKTANFTAVANEGYLVNTTSSAITVTLPSSPSLGDEVLIMDYAGTFGTNNVTLTSSNNINGTSDNKNIATNKTSYSLIYTDSTQGWKIKSSSVNDSLVAPNFTADYLVVAGGGGGCDNTLGGGGGAGGLRTSYGSTSGGGASAESSLTLAVSTNYTVTIGAGGGEITNGSNSVFSSITSIGGGAGRAGNGNTQGNNGGSGGGAGYVSGTLGGSGTANQGFDGGTGRQDGGSNSVGGGGGGAGEAGSTDETGAGGDGLAVSITGVSVTYAGGGSGSTNIATTIPAGDGGGGTGASQGLNTVGTNGTANTGGGGGAGGGGTPNTGATGGSGIVIVRYPNTYTISVGAGLTSSTTTDGSFKVTSFTAGTDSISFS